MQQEESLAKTHAEECPKYHHLCKQTIVKSKFSSCLLQLEEKNFHNTRDKACPKWQCVCTQNIGKRAIVQHFWCNMQSINI
jgi:hypothetical protein